MGRKRDPIEVYKNEDGTYTVADGNATIEIAKRLGWSKVPAVITKKPAGTIAPVNEKIAQLSRDVLDVAEGAKEGYFRDARAAAAQVGGVVPANDCAKASGRRWIGGTRHCARHDVIDRRNWPP